MKNKPVIGIDFDNVLADISHQFERLMKEMHNIEVKKSQVTVYEPDRSAHLVFNDKVSENDLLEIFSRIWLEPEKVPLVSESIPEITKELSKLYEVKITTATHAKREVLEKWLSDHNVFYSGIIYVGVGAHENKVADSVDIFIDDYTLVAKFALEKGKVAILLTEPWNTDAETVLGSEKFNGRFIRCENWEEIRRALIGDRKRLLSLLGKN